MIFYLHSSLFIRNLRLLLSLFCVSLKLCYNVAQCVFCNDFDCCARVGWNVTPSVIATLWTLPICVMKSLSDRKLARLALGVGCPVPIAVVKVEASLLALTLAAGAFYELTSVCAPDIYENCGLILWRDFCYLGFALLLGACALGDRVVPLVVAVVINAVF